MTAAPRHLRADAWTAEDAARRGHLDALLGQDRLAAALEAPVSAGSVVTSPRAAAGSTSFRSG